MNNLPLLTSLPPHIRNWGTGDLSLVKNDDTATGESSTTRRVGEGLEVLDLGNCSLPYEAISTFLVSRPTPKPPQSKKGKSTGPPKSEVTWPNLRSLSLHSNPLCITHPTYSEDLQASTNLPKLQIVDMKRVVERKRKGEVSETKEEKRRREKREAKMRPSGANVGGGAMRSWGGEEVAASVAEGEGGAKSVGSNGAEDQGKSGAGSKAEKHLGKEGKKRKRDVATGPTETANEKSQGTVESQSEQKRSKKVRRERPATEEERAASDAKKVAKAKRLAGLGPGSVHDDLVKRKLASSSSAAPQSHPPFSGAVADPSALVPPSKKPSKSETSVIGVIDVIPTLAAKDKSNHGKKVRKDKVQEEKTSTGQVVDLKEMFGKSAVGIGGKGDEGDSGTGLGVGGW